MISKIKQKILNFVSKNPVLTILIVVFLISITYIFINISKQNSNNKINTSSTPVSTIEDKSISTGITKSSGIPYSNNPNETFFINQIITNKTPVTGYSWKENKLIYSTPSGIYEAGTNSVIIETIIEKIIWNNSFNSLIKNNGNWKILDYLNKKTTNLSYSLNDPKISGDGKTIIDYSDNIVKLYDLDQNLQKEITLNENINKILISNDLNFYIVSTSFGLKTYIYKLDRNLSIVESIDFENEYELSSISDDGNIFSLTQKNILIVSNFSNKLFDDSFLDKSELISSFRNNNEIIIIEKYKDSLDRTLDNIYITNISGNRYKISDSKTIKNRINTNLNISFNGDKNIITFAENTGKIWIISLKSNLIATYSIEGNLVFSNIGDVKQGF